MEQIYSYNQQPTLLVGLGGFGSRLTDNIYGDVKDSFNVSAFAIDTDIHDSERLRNIPNENIISIFQHSPLSHALSYLPNTNDWFPNNSILFHKTLSEGAGQVRAVARLIYELSLKEHRFDPLLNKVKELSEECIKNKCRMRISIISTLVGGTASGIFIQIALLIREYISTNFPTLNAKIQGEFILPSAFASFTGLSRAETSNFEANTYAALKELNSINAHYFSNTSPIELHFGYSQNDNEKKFVDALPYDYCFLYDKFNSDHNINNKSIENAITERLFSDSSNDLNDAFVNELRFDTRKRAGNLYGSICTEKFSLETVITDSEIYNSIINSAPTDGRKIILLVRSPKKLNIDTTLFAPNVIFIEKVDISACAVTITRFDFGIELSKINELKLQNGQYYLSYKNLINQLPLVITPHLSKKWHEELSDIGQVVNINNLHSAVPPLHQIPTDNFVFISYSSKEIDIANQLKHILETNGVPCWMAPQSLPAGSDYGSEIPKAIEKCKVFLLLLSDASQNSNWVPKEVGLAIGRGKTVVPFQIDNAAISEAFNFYLTNSQRISAYNRMTEAYQELLNRLKDILF